MTKLSMGVVLVTFLVGMGVGYWLTPEYQMQSQQMKVAHDLGPADQWVDLRYIDGMIAHHLSAIYMLEQAQKNSSRTEIQQLANTVITADKAGIEQLYALKKEWYGNERPVTQYRQQNLGDADANFDLRLINALLIHHEEAIRSAREVSTKSVRTGTLNTANEVTEALTANAIQLKQWREAWYGIN